MIEELASSIWGRTAFQNDYTNLLHQSLSRAVHVTDVQEGEPDLQTLKRLLQSATHFALTNELAHREAAYRIATSAWTMFGQEYRSIREIALVILARLGNFPAVNHLYEGRPDLGADLPESMWIEYAAKAMQNEVTVVVGDNVVLTDFQKRLWDTLETGVSTAVTAPTSAGKSFALQRYVIHELLRVPGWALYLVPTRALINQVSTGLAELSRRYAEGALAVETIPVSPSELGAKSGVYVLTQERLQILLETSPELSLKIAIIDEAQMLADGARGIILQTVVEKLRQRNPLMQVLFGSPQTSNPDVFRGAFELDALEVIRELESPVAQNLVFVDTDSIRREQVSVSAMLRGEKKQLGTLRLDHSLYDQDQTLACLAWVFGRNEKNLVYAGGQAKCEHIADKLVQLKRSSDEDNKPTVDPIVEEFSRFIKEHVHSQYLLADTVLWGVAFHYGNMPAIIRKTVEDLFDEGHLSYLVCTSTLLHGVNLPARNLFLLNPMRGGEERKGVPISPLEFWNLAGRAGRLGKEFEGNVYLIDIDRWESNPLTGAKQEEVIPAVATAIQGRSQEFLAFIKDREHGSGQSPAFENAFVKLVNEYRATGESKSLLRNPPQDAMVRGEIQTLIANAAQHLDVPRSVAEKNINVSLFRQQEMLDYMVRRIREAGPERLIPVHPLRPWKEAWDSLLLVFKRVHSRFEKIPPADRRHFYFVPLALRWMRGDPLPRLIDDAHKYKLRKAKRTIGIAPVIRQVMADVEEALRFRYVKYTSCYNDLLAVALERTGHADLVSRIPGIPLFLELGACSKTMVHLIGIGLSRTSAGVITERAINKDMSRVETAHWLRAQDWVSADVSPIIKREIERFI